MFNVLAHIGHTLCLLSELPGDEFFVIRLFLSAVKTPVLFSLAVLAVFFIPFGTVLLFTQLRIVATNMNTNELLNMHRYSHFWRPQDASSSEDAAAALEEGGAGAMAKAQKELMMRHLQTVAFVNPFDKGVMKNCLHFWTGDDSFWNGLTIPTPKRIGNFQLKRVNTCCDHGHGHSHNQEQQGDIELGGLGGIVGGRE
jgi:hypothetical protein